MKAANQYTTRRRKALAFGGSARGNEQDAELLILCAEYRRALADLDEWVAVGFGLEPSGKRGEAYRIWKAEDDRFFNAERDLFRTINALPATTPHGLAAKGAVLAGYIKRHVADANGSLADEGDHVAFSYTMAQNAVQIAGGVA